MTENQEQKILVTGAEGFIGSHLVEALVKQGYSVKAFVAYNSFSNLGWLEHTSNDIKQSVEFVMGDVRDFSTVKHAMKGCKKVLHLAALIAIPYSYLAPKSYIDVNVTGTMNVAQAAVDMEIEKMVHTSTSEVYGTAQFVPITEQHPLYGQSPYAASKIGADQMAYAFSASCGLNLTIIRPFNTYGPRQSARAIIPTIISQIAAGKRKLHLGALTPTRDFNFVEDTVDGFIKAMATNESLQRTINLGTGYEISIGELVTLIAELMNVEIDIESEEARVRPKDSEVQRLLADNQLARELLNWSPRKSGRDGLVDGLNRTISWFSKAENLAQYKTNQYNI